MTISQMLLNARLKFLERKYLELRDASKIGSEYIEMYLKLHPTETNAKKDLHQIKKALGD